MKHERRVSHVAGAGGARGPQQRAQLVRGGGERVRGQTVELVKAPPRAAQRNAAQQATHTFRVHCLKITLILCNILILLKKTDSRLQSNAYPLSYDSFNNIFNLSRTYICNKRTFKIDPYKRISLQLV